MTTPTTHKWLNFDTIAAWMSAYNESQEHSWNKLLDFKPNDYTKTLFETTTELEFEDFNEAYREIFVEVWKELNNGYYRQDWWKSLQEVTTMAKLRFSDYYLDNFIENEMATIDFTEEYLFNNQIINLRHIYDGHKDEIQVDFDEFTNLLKDFLRENECYMVIDNTFDDIDEVEIPCFLAITGNEHFNLEAGNDGYQVYYYYSQEDTDPNEVDNPTTQYLHKIGSNYDEFINSDNPNETIKEMRQALDEAGDNATLGMPIVLTLGKIRELFSAPYPQITIPYGAKLGYHGYVYGSGSMGFVTITNPRDVTFQPGQWTLVPEDTYGYSLFDVYGMDEDEIKEMNNLNDIVISEPDIISADTRNKYFDVFDVASELPIDAME